MLLLVGLLLAEIEFHVEGEFQETEKIEKKIEKKTPFVFSRKMMYCTDPALYLSCSSLSFFTSRMTRFFPGLSLKMYFEMDAVL